MFTTQFYWLWTLDILIDYGHLTTYMQVVRWNYTGEERRALLELIGYIKSIGLMMQRCDTLVSEALWETIHMEVQDFVQDKLDTMLRTTFRKKKDLSRLLVRLNHPYFNMIL
jgi:hypothetical protein